MGVVESENFPKINNGDCYWLGREGCTFDPDKITTCCLNVVCRRYFSMFKIDDYIRHLQKEYELLESSLKYHS